LSHTRPNVLVIGGGVIGTSIAYHLTRKKVRVTLLEQGELASGSSGACDGLVFLQSKKPGVHLQLAMESRKRFEQLIKDLPIPIGFKSTGGMVVIENEAELDAMRLFVQEQRKIGLDVSLLDAQQKRKLEPHLSDHIVGATHSLLDGQVHPIALAHAFALGAKKLKARILTATRVEGIEISGNRVVSVDTSKGRFYADIIVNAAGVSAPEIGKMIGLQIPIKPRRGQIVVTEACHPMLKHCLISAKYIASKFNPDLAESNSEGISIEQTKDGNLLLGSTREFVGFDKRTTIEGLNKIIRQTSEIIPPIRGLKIIRAFAGLRPYTPDGLPILGPVETIQGFIMAAGHEGDGIALSPITGELIAQLIVDNRSDIPLDDFRLNRFRR
jgi:sarcosine oxidase subunit beta